MVSHFVFWTALLLTPLLTAQTVPGLMGSFTDGTRTARFIAATPNFVLAANESIHPSLDPSFRGEWTGLLQVLAAGEYEFTLPVSVDDRIGIKHTLSSGTHRLRIAYTRTVGEARMRLQWRSRILDWEPVPRDAFSHQGSVNPVEQGRVLVFDARCANCHRAAGMDRAAPALEGIGGRANGNWINAFLRTHYDAGARAADLTAHLSTLRGPAARTRRANEVAVGKGGELFGTIGCVMCHGTIRGLGSKYTLPAMTAVLLDHRPSMLLTDEEATAIAAALVRSTDTSMEKAAPPGDARNGAQLLEALGCVSCHARKGDAKPLWELKSAACTKVAVSWNDSEKKSAAAFLNGPRDRHPAPVYGFHFELRKYDCLKCHKAGTEAPPLESVGEKLKTSWIGEVLWGKKRIRPGREMRMPHFVEGEMKPWLAAFAKAEGALPGDGTTPPPFTDEQRTSGMGMLGTNPAKKGMACIGCHDWGVNKSLGEEGPQLINSAARMRFEWYERWMHNPARILSGTSMPGYFASLPRERALPPIHALWAGLELGTRAPAPDGYRASDLNADGEAKPVVGKAAAVVVRWDMPEATPAAIAVGLPGGLSYCFDAGESRLLYAWRGGFIDLTDTLLKKTDKNKRTPTAALVGEMLWKSAAFPILMGADKRIPARKFKGYELVGGLPRFHYQVDGIDVFEWLTPLTGEFSIRRQITFSRVDRQIFFEGREVPRGLDVMVEVKLAR